MKNDNMLKRIRRMKRKIREGRGDIYESLKRSKTMKCFSDDFQRSKSLSKVSK